MTSLLLTGITVAGLIAFAYRRLPVSYTSFFLGAMTFIAIVSPAHAFTAALLAILTTGSLLFSITSVRKKVVSAPALKLLRKLLPPISETEHEAIDAGNVWWDGEIFSGKPTWNKLMSAPVPQLTAAEQAFIDGPVTELNRMTDSWKINHDWNIVPEPIIRYVCEQGFLGMIIPKEYGGLDFSPVAQSQVLLNLSNAGGGVMYLVAVPNSLGPGELLIKYGTEAQKNYYLPRLAKGKEIPCFALTGPTAGSDATSIPDTGVVCKGMWQGKEVLGMRLNFSKRYITLAPIATLIGLAFRLQDPDGLLGDVEDYGITCALIPRHVRGLEIGRRHVPVGDVFLNGPIKGKDVFVPLDSIIGGPEMAGMGWRMLVNCLSVGRAVTLPTTSIAVSKRMAMGASAYAKLRQQFGVPIAKFEGIQKPLARIAGLSYIIDAARLQTIQSIVDGNKPSVPSAILKYHCTEMARQCVLDAMDIHGGKTVITGPRNYVAPMYESIPIAITVEGANILTRNLMIFGQGAIRSHPFVLKEMELAQALDSTQTLDEFDATLGNHLGYSVSNIARSLVLGLGLSSGGDAPAGRHEIKRYYHQLNRLSSVFAMTADTAMLSLGARLKFKEGLSARLGDLLSNLYLASMVLKHHKDSGYEEGEWPIVQWGLEHLLHRFQVAFEELMANFPNKALAGVIKRLAFPLGGRFKAPEDALEKKVVEVISVDSAARRRLTAGMYEEVADNNPLAFVNDVFLESLKLAPLHQQLHQAIKDGLLPKLAGDALVRRALSEHIISNDEARQLLAYNERLMDVINVDDFEDPELIRVPFEDQDDHENWLKAS